MEKLQVDREHLQSDNKLKKKNIEILDLKIIDLTSITQTLKEHNHKLEQDNQTNSNKLNESQKMNHSKKLEIDNLKKQLNETKKHLENKIKNLESNLK